MDKSEAKIQSEIVQWYHNNFCLPKCSPRQMIFHVPNENQFKLINVGVYSGVSDLVVIHNNNVLMIEVKAENGIQSESQKRFEVHCKQTGIEYFIVRSLDAFKTLIEFYNFKF